MNITGMMHVNVNCSDYERSREFYEFLGFKVLWEVPTRNTPEVAAAVGMPPYKVRGALLHLAGSPTTPLIDLLEWKEPRDSETPYPHLYHLGIARIALLTSNMEADVQALKARGVELLSEPVVLSPPDAPPARFVCFKDPDGTISELVETNPLPRQRDEKVR
jgi:catechol 2,3-dioxygenase-like lactoylglutathione lyase family enzyme